MAITIVGSITPVVSPASTDVTFINGQHTTTSDTDLLLCCVAVEGNENPSPTNPCRFDLSGSDTALTLISDSLSTGSNAGVRTLIYGMVSPGAVTDAQVRFSVEFSANPFAHVWVNISGTVTTSLAAATNDLEQVFGDTVGSTTVFASAGGTGNGLLVWGAAQGNDMAPSSTGVTFTKQVGTSTGATTSDLSVILSTLVSGAPSAVTITWNTTDENGGNLIELLPAASTNLLPDYSGTRGIMRGVGRGI